jgi:hypothetical protein
LILNPSLVLALHKEQFTTGRSFPASLQVLPALIPVKDLSLGKDCNMQHESSKRKTCLMLKEIECFWSCQERIEPKNQMKE